MEVDQFAMATGNFLLIETPKHEDDTVSRTRTFDVS
jgi:hypothetical protein